MTHATVGGRVHAFLSWWRGELREMLPGWARPRGPEMVLDLRGPSPALARRSSRGAPRWMATAPFPGIAGAPLRQLRAQPELVLAVPPPWILRRVLPLPEAAAPRLQAVLGFEIEQHIPFAAEEVVWAARILRHLPEAQRIEVEVAVLPRRLVADQAAALRAAGIGAPLVARPDPGAAWPSLSLDALSPPRRSWRRGAEAGLGIAALALGAMLAVAVLDAGEARVAAVERRATEARAAAEQVLALEAEAQALRQRLAAAAELRGARPATVAVLEEVARLLPDDTWLTELRLAGDALALTGFAAGATERLLETLDASPMLGEVRFAAPVTRGPRDPADRFQLVLRVTPPPPPSGARALEVAGR